MKKKIFCVWMEKNTEREGDDEDDDKEWKWKKRKLCKWALSKFTSSSTSINCENCKSFSFSLLFHRLFPFSNVFLVLLCFLFLALVAFLYFNFTLVFHSHYEWWKLNKFTQTELWKFMKCFLYRDSFWAAFNAYFCRFFKAFVRVCCVLSLWFDVDMKYLVYFGF